MKRHAYKLRKYPTRARSTDSFGYAIAVPAAVGREIDGQSFTFERDADGRLIYTPVKP